MTISHNCSVVRVNRYKVHPTSLDDFTTTWLHEFLILMIWSSGFFEQNYEVIDYVCSPFKNS